jgi:hypothetical protein
MYFLVLPLFSSGCKRILMLQAADDQQLLTEHREVSDEVTRLPRTCRRDLVGGVGFSLVELAANIARDQSIYFADGDA